jgi:hypothetical protein
MRARALFAGTVGVLFLAVATPAAAKAMIAEAHISGPGLGGGGLRISAPATEGLWESGIDVAGGLDDARAGSIADLGLTAGELGPRYVVSYRFDVGPSRPAEVVRQELYPYAKGGPVTYTPPGQRLAEGQPWGGAISAGWYQSSLGFFHYLVDQGLPETNPVAAAADRESAPDTASAARSTPWGWIALALAGLVVPPLAAPRLRRRVLAVARALH